MLQWGSISPGTPDRKWVSLLEQGPHTPPWPQHIQDYDSTWTAQAYNVQVREPENCNSHSRFYKLLEGNLHLAECTGYKSSIKKKSIAKALFPLRDLRLHLKRSLRTGLWKKTSMQSDPIPFSIQKLCFFQYQDYHHCLHSSN